MSDEATKTPIAVLGAGSFGTALALQLARCRNPVTLWGRNAAQMDAMQAARCNEQYLPDGKFPELITATGDLAGALAGCRDVLIVTPSHGFRATLTAAKPYLANDARIAWGAKGLEGGQLLDRVAREIVGDQVPLAVVSGPTFAKEIALELPTAVTVASEDQGFARDMAARLHGRSFRAYTHDDIIGVQVGGAVKNIMAIGAGITDGLKLGANTRTALITRGLAEIMRLGMALGAQQDSFMGLAGLGDLVLTCTDNLSRNRRMGLALAAGKSVAEAAEEIGQVVEGVGTAAEVWKLAREMEVDMPITEQIYAICHEGREPKQALLALISRAPRSEFE